VGWDSQNLGGAIFVPQSSGIWDGLAILKYTLAATWGSDFMNVYIVGDGGTILHTTNGGARWNHEDVSSAPLWGVWGSAAGDVYAVGNQGTILHAKSGTWASEKSG